MSEDLPSMARALTLQAGACRGMGSPLSGDLLDRAAADWLDGGVVHRLTSPWAELGLKPIFDAAVPLRLLASWRELALSGDDAAVSEAYGALDAERIWAAVLPAMTADPARFEAFMTHEPQTNEVRRSIGLLGGFLEIGGATGLPMRCFEIAASAGLNLSWDRYRYAPNNESWGGAAWGDPDAAVAIDTDWQGGPPDLAAPVRVIERASCDRRPTDLHNPAERRRLLSYIWADQGERISRIGSAIALALANDIRVEAADALDWVNARVRPQAGAVTVLYHSVFWSYMSAGQQAALAAAIEALGAQATAEAPFAWLRMEPPPDDITTMDVRLTLWPGGQERLLSQANPHCIWVRWLADANPS